MSKLNLQKRLDELRRRRVRLDDYDKLEKIAKSYALSESIGNQAYGYIIGAMAPVSRKYTENIINEGVRVFDCIDKALPGKYSIQKRFQGSVTTDTHIRYYSDIDVLTLTNEYHKLSKGLPNPNPYVGCSRSHLLDLRDEEYDILNRSFYKASVDNTGGKSIELSGGSLICKVDVVPCAWYRTHASHTSGYEVDKGIHLVDKNTFEDIYNFPFLHKFYIDYKNNDCKNNLKKLIRFLKVFKADMKKLDGINVDLNSYDITSIAYNLSELDLKYSNEIELIQKFINFVQKIENDETFQESMLVPNKTRKVFNRPGMMNELLKMSEQLIKLFNIANEEIQLNKSSLLYNRESNFVSPYWES